MTRLLAAGAVLALVTALSCFSDRATIFDPGLANCTVPAGAFGRNRVPVIIRDFTFHDDTVRIRRGGTVTWVNCEDPNVEAHTTTSTGGVWDSDLLQPGTSFAHTFPNAGTFPFACRPHDYMRGVVIVE